MYFLAFLLGVLLTLVVGTVVLVRIGRSKRGRAFDEGVSTVQVALEDLVDELHDESEAYLDELRRILSK